MEKSVDLLVRDHQWVAWLSVVSLVSFAASVVTVAIVGGDTGRHGLEILAGCMMAVLVTSSFVAMVGATIAVVRNRARLADWGMFLIFIWCVPYLGVTFYLSPVFLMGLLRRRSRVSFGAGDP
ncbi:MULTISPECIES: hypothetical protein [Stenotrophomonas]|uniref:hypothetical protein n=1 Tax=Stenotrophomonas TaxID=40323 RepID=UPI000871BDAA|nr:MULTISPECIES: hypothetical protein [Stenotrophomonas]OEZ02108.1 hypothetical protein BIY45_02750 [Stenotrophomonas sp. BIIR7]